MKHYKTQGGIIIMYSSLNIVVAISKANPFSTGRYDGTGYQVRQVAKYINVFVRLITLFDRYSLNFLEVK